MSGNDETCLEAMRHIMKEYIAYRRQSSHSDEVETKLSFKNRYDEWRQKVHDDTLRTYTAFEFMEKLYWQEYLIKE